MRHFQKWPWRYAYAAAHYCNTTTTADRRGQHRDGDARGGSLHESRWHGHGSAGFGVRRPLRYLTYRLDLDESQTRRMAAVLNQLKTEREQAAVDEKRTVAALATLLEAGTPTLEEAREVLAGRVTSAKQLRNETAKAVVAVSDFLDDDQRQEFISLLLTGAVSF